MKVTGMMVVLFFCVGKICVPTCLWGQDSFTPWVFDRAALQHAEHHSQSEVVQGMEGVILQAARSVLQAISRVDGDRCPMVPTCSSYALQAFQKHGFGVGYIMTCDRLMRCGGSDTAWVPIVDTVEGSGYLDRIADNDFWWFKE